MVNPLTFLLMGLLTRLHSTPPRLYAIGRTLGVEDKGFHAVSHNYLIPLFHAFDIFQGIFTKL